MGQSWFIILKLRKQCSQQKKHPSTFHFVFQSTYDHHNTLIKSVLKYHSKEKNGMEDRGKDNIAITIERQGVVVQLA